MGLILLLRWPFWLKLVKFVWGRMVPLSSFLPSRLLSFMVCLRLLFVAFDLLDVTGLIFPAYSDLASRPQLEDELLVLLLFARLLVVDDTCTWFLVLGSPLPGDLLKEFSSSS